MEGFLLAVLLEERFKKIYGQEISGKSLTNYKKDNRKKVTDFLKSLGLEEYLDDFKEPSYSGNGYWFYNEEKEFICAILDLSKENIYKLIRERKYESLTDDEAIAVFEYVHKMLLRRGLTGEDLNRRLEGPYNLLDYPFRNVTQRITKSVGEFYKIQEFMFRERHRLLTSANDNLAWISYVEHDLKRTVDRYFEIFKYMHINRRDEISDLSILQYCSMSDEEREVMYNEQELSTRSHSIYMNIQEVQKLIEEEDLIMGIPKNIRERMNWVPRDDYSSTEIKRMREILKKKNEYYSIAYKKAVSELAKERGVTEEEVTKQRIIDWQVFKSSENLLKEAIDEIDHN